VKAFCAYSGKKKDIFNREVTKNAKKKSFYSGHLDRARVRSYELVAIRSKAKFYSQFLISQSYQEQDKVSFLTA